MKKVLVIVCVAAFMLSIATVAMAAETSWLLAARTSDASYNFAPTAVQVGVSPSVGTNAWSAGTDIQAKLALWSPELYPTYSNNFASQDRKAALDGTNAYTWEYRMWLGEQYEATSLVLGFWNLAAMDMPQTIAGVEYVYTLTMISDPTETYTAGTKWVLDASKNGTSTSPDLLLLPFDNFGGLKMTASNAVQNGVKFSFTAEPVPEPGSMLALASGLVGMAGFAIRRRRA